MATVPSSSLVGRERELAILRDQLAAASGGHGSLVLIGGEAGIGKTALTETVCREAGAQGALVLIGRCYDLTETPPYGPWLELFGRYRQADALPPLPVAFAARGTVGAVPSQAALFRQVLDFLAALTAQRPAVLFLDDLHWSDPASLDLLRSLAQSIETLPLMMVVTYRSDDLSRYHPLYRLLPVLEREAHATRLDLRRLPPPAVRSLVARRYPLADTDIDRLVTYLFARAAGNVFFTIQLIRALEEEEVLRLIGNDWAIGDLDQIRLPMAVRQVIDGRLLRLDGESQRLLAVAAVIGQEVSFAVWMAVGGHDEATLLETVEQATAAHLIDALADGSGFRFVHALIREALYEGIVPLRRRGLHRQVGEALAAARNPDVDAVAYHFGQAGDVRAVAWLVQAGERAQRAWAWPTASERYEAALARLEIADATAGERGWLLFRLASVSFFYNTQRGIAHLEEAERLALAAGDRVLAALSRIRQGDMRWLKGDVRRGLAQIEAGTAALSTLAPADRARLATLHIDEVIDERTAWAGLFQSLTNTGRFAEARALQARVFADPAGMAAASAVTTGSPNAERGLAFIHASLGRPEEAGRLYALAREGLQAEGDDLEAGLTALDELRFVALAYKAEDLAGRRQIAAESERLYVRASGHQARLPSERGRQPLMIVEGAWAEARAVGEAVIAVGGHGAYLSHAQCALGPLAHAQGDTKLAWTMVEQTLPAGHVTAPGDIPWFAGATVMQRLAAALAIDAADLNTARHWLEAHDRWLAWSGSILGRAEGQLGWAAYHRASSDPVHTRVHARQALAHATDPRQPLALLATHRLLGELATEAGHFADAATHLDAALALADACAAPYERALTLLAQAELRGLTGHHAAARTLLDEVRAICVPLAAQPTLAKTDALTVRLDAIVDPPPAYPAGLSAREVEVLRLVAAGRTNREIAELFFLSVPTINNHVAHILAKTNTANRAEAAAFAQRHGLV